MMRLPPAEKQVWKAKREEQGEQDAFHEMEWPQKNAEKRKNWLSMKPEASNPSNR